MKRILTITLALALVLSTMTVSAFADPGNGKGNGQLKKEFKDTNGHWGSAAIEQLQDLGILEGYEDGTFRPDETLTPEQLAVMLDALLEKRLALEDEDVTLTEAEEEELADVPAWAKKAVRKGVKNQYLNMERFHSATQCDRLSAVVQLAKALGLEPVTDVTDNPFKDSNLMSDEDFGYVLALYEAGIIKGYPDGNFNPNALINRAQMASIIDKIFDEEDETSKDTTAPTWPTGSAITASAITPESLILKWTAAADDTAVAVYKISYTLEGVDKEKFAYSNRTATIKGLTAEKEYTFTVEARDAAGNWSKTGPTIQVTTSKIAE
ncbi:MAG: S-layer homology domain-containing protein [Eubacteriales bacterium]|nr:S-layer homology domain-containing protein [Eubacteriales bacterium]MDD3350140.1 S-layer homology domain-containing protein [Eubacteriales bacterium]